MSGVWGFCLFGFFSFSDVFNLYQGKINLSKIVNMRRKKKANSVSNRTLDVCFIAWFPLFASLVCFCLVLFGLGIFVLFGALWFVFVLICLGFF